MALIIVTGKRKKMKKVVESQNEYDSKSARRMERFFKKERLPDNAYTRFLYAEIYCRDKCTEDSFLQEVFQQQQTSIISAIMISCKMYNTKTNLMDCIAYLQSFKLRFEQELISYLLDEEMARKVLSSYANKKIE